MTKITSQQAYDVLSAWTALEVLSPQSFQRPEDLVNGNLKSIVFFDEEKLPWERGDEEIPLRRKLFYQIVLGTIDLQKAVDALTSKYGDEGLEPPTMNGESIICVLTVDQYGHPLLERALSLSSFAWGMPQSLNGQLSNLSDWPSHEIYLLENLNKIIRHKDHNENPKPLNKEFLHSIYLYLIHLLEIPEDMVKETQFTVKCYERLDKIEPSQSLVLNSFYLKDLAKAKDLLVDNQAPDHLKKYLGIDVPETRFQILEEDKKLEAVLAPQNIPLGRWPSPGGHPLVLLQQGAVNAALSQLEKNEILAINGPPGTGKTTLLRDIVAGLVTERAKALAKFDDPAEAFTDSKHIVEAGNGSFKLYNLHDNLKGFEILIASSNNKAVENVSAELPNLKAIDEDAEDLRYFKVLSDTLLDNDTWGLISAVLGNSGNRYHFKENFWWDRDVGMSVYLAEATGSPQLFEVIDPKTKKIIDIRKPRIVQENNPPHHHTDALRCWQNACQRFKQALKACQNTLEELQNIRQSSQKLEALEATLQEDQTVELLLQNHEKLKPGFLNRFLKLSSTRLWQEECQRLLSWQNLKKEVSSSNDNLGSHKVDSGLFSKTSEEKNLISPWCDAKTNALRDTLFIEAINLHKAFIAAAAKPLRHNLGILMQNFGKSSGSIEKKVLDAMSDLWSSLFLIVPSISTTFASAGRMLEALAPNSLGWLLIDEAGQAVPQAAVGAMLRTKRSIMTGDPLQIEPVVSLPSNLTKNICKKFKVDETRFNAPESSIQTLADAASVYFAEIQGTSSGDRLVGFPLLVHRRCADPMFGISNKIAYKGLMVQAKRKNNSLIRDCLGPSAWFEVQGNSQDKWCPEEGEKVLELLMNLKKERIDPDLYIITPFKMVANKLRTIICDSGILDSWISSNINQWLCTHVGTVHTAQGRESEAIIVVLGAPRLDQEGARVWAGSSPNLLNVAVTRAKEALYVIGNVDLWKGAGVFKELYNRIEIVKLDNKQKRAL